MTARLLKVALLAYPARVRRRDGEVILGCALDLISGGSTAAREAGGLLTGGLKLRLGAARAELAAGPWTSTLNRLAVPLAAANLSIWSVGAARYIDLPLGRWWTAVLAAAAITFIASVARRRGLAVAGWGAMLCLMAQSLWQANVEATTGSDFSSGLFHWSVDMTAAFLPLMIVGLVSAVRLSGPARVEDLAYLVPALALVALARASGTLYVLEAPPAEAALLIAFFAAPLVALAARHTAMAALLFGIAAPEAVWLSTAFMPYPGPTGALLLLAGMYGLAAAGVIGLARRSGRSRIE